jgi:hypothetical protein
MTPTPQSTPNHCHKQLLMGWKGVLCQCMGMRVGQGDRGNEWRGPQQHTALCIEGKVLEIQPFKDIENPPGMDELSSI